MAQYELDLRDYGRILIKRKKEIIFATLLVGFLTFMFTPAPKPNYKARSSVRVTQSSTLTGLFVQAISYSRWNNMETQAKIIQSMPVVVEAAKRMGKIESEMTLTEIINSEEDLTTINNLMENILTQQLGKTDIIEIIATAENPKEAIAFANHLADAFIDFSTQQKNASIDEAAHFIQEQLNYYKENLRLLEIQLEEFKRENLDKISITDTKTISLLDEYDDVIKRITTLEIQVQQLKERLNARENSFIDWVSTEMADAALTTLNTKLVELQIEKEALLIHQTPNSPEVMELEEQIQKICRDVIKEFEDKIRLLRSRADVLANRLDQLPGNDLQYNRILRELKVNEEVYSLLSSKFQEAKIKQAEKIKEMSVVEYATLALKFVQNGKWSKTLLGLVVGMLLGLVVAFVMETLDTSIGAIQDVEDYLKIPVLGVVPHYEMEHIKEKILRNNPKAADDPYLDFHSELVTQFSPKSPISESYRTLATNIDFARLKHEGGKELILTSATMQEGKSTTIVNLAIAMAQMGHRVLIIGCNLRRPTIYKVFGLDIGPGVKDIALGLTDWRDCVRTINDIALGKMSVTEELLRDGAWSRLNIITCGGVYHNPSEIFSAPKMRDFMEEIKPDFDFILIDCPPVLPVTDAAILASKVDGSILVYQVGKIARGALKRAKSHLEAVNSTVWGIVLNDFKAEISGFGADVSYYGKYYGSASESKSKSGVEKVFGSNGVSKMKKFRSKAKKMFARKSPYEIEDEESFEDDEDNSRSPKPDSDPGDKRGIKGINNPDRKDKGKT